LRNPSKSVSQVYFLSKGGKMRKIGISATMIILAQFLAVGHAQEDIAKFTSRPTASTEERRDETLCNHLDCESGMLMRAAASDINVRTANPRR
jgi:hypothetical protein